MALLGHHSCVPFDILFCSKFSLLSKTFNVNMFCHIFYSNGLCRSKLSSLFGGAPAGGNESLIYQPQKQPVKAKGMEFI